MSKKIVDALKVRANELMHRNVKQKDELMSDVQNLLSSKKYPRDVYDAFNLIDFDYNEIHQLNNGKKPMKIWHTIYTLHLPHIAR